jgi:TetR/AcrR family transcriptional regulator
VRGKILDDTTARKIKAAAKMVFVARGYDGTTMQAIAEASGVNKALLHYYYRSKDNLFQMIFREQLEHFTRTLTDALKMPAATARERLEAWVDRERTLLNQDPQLPLFLLGEVRRNPALIKDLLQGVITPEAAAVQAETFKDLAAEAREFAPDQILVLVYSLLMFPLLAAPLIQALLGVPPERWSQILDTQAALAKDLLKRFLGK